MVFEDLFSSGFHLFSIVIHKKVYIYSGSMSIERATSGVPQGTVLVRSIVIPNVYQ